MKVYCINATPIPHYCGTDYEAHDFTFPLGFLSEGQTYHVEQVVPLPNQTQGYVLTGLPILFKGSPISWHCSRFRRLSARPAKKVAARKETKIPQ